MTKIDYEKHYHKEVLVFKDKVRRTKDTNPCDNCIELECENHGVVCHNYRTDMREADNEQ